MYEDNTIEDKYLYNFSKEEKDALFAHKHYQEWKQADLNRRFTAAMATNSSELLLEEASDFNSAVEIKYVLNRIAANDPRDTTFDLASSDEIANPDRLALDIAKAFQHNTHCKNVVLGHIGLTDNGMLPILRALSKKELCYLYIGGNKITDESLQALDTILANPETSWAKVNLGRINMSKERQESLKRYPNLSFSVHVPLIERIKQWGRLENVQR